ncbi:hypothetical protein UFOVP1470_15 [uncultured Caudovirales phage]|uniref:Uncharacterized protein n=1 Tax=uncultured Caudovirales phage TaxID=2100421 RepID=A0A6J5Q844_9CAUD|nr:hypothetical protein UFOVP939_11 [uncultured Caudovirales phage]CAB4178557.1 hypothetical protein UFOVP1018_13 [uncultured Caudovirales phage]CAB4183886.1 hypothetical protein UFOVP1105_14 [uncultured Caudovirales phage]CAB4202307.1 hypothetical protein UFOVP1372_4 [uncultured Caudovirales phage]CAB4214987.1 hypothetical protein UFOVP1470_15 [uncultured Caudovirales phage]
MALQILATGVNITTGAASAGATIPVKLDGTVPLFIRITASVAACVRVGYGAQTAVATDAVVQPGQSLILSTGQCTHVAAIQQAAAGVVQVSPCEDV